eukprot:CAMPEP_0116543380 /NCGR_PEP_ID=MMETSP0397-20121206/1526_1 /TAXON_ID=216820 /ORGANISM="Cyclophora tenuis, Strain ECT3854" /LENGTH=204 /DNA_ID=CAMNT_0004067467 /DNA_START=205 /DNA_END=819 /DNA_ORIENTATION=+
MAGYYFLAAVAMMGVLFGVKLVKFIYFMHDLICGHVLFIPLFILAALQLPSHIQTWLLYHNALSADVVVGDILRYARKNRDSGGDDGDEDLAEQVAELRKLVQKQEELLTNAGVTQNALGGNVEPPSQAPQTDAMADLVSTSSPNLQITTPSAPGRSLSMSGLDVWSDMALGDGVGSRDDQGTGFDMPRQAGFSFTQPDTMPPR